MGLIKAKKLCSETEWRGRGNIPMSDNDIYRDIFVDENLLDDDRRRSLARQVSPNIKIYMSGSSYKAKFTMAGNKLSVQQKLLVYLLARKILQDRGLIQLEGMSPGELESETGIPGGTVRPNLRKLLDIQLLENNKEEKGGYYVPNYALERTEKELKTDG
jgi:hypothetical protein